MNRQAWRDFFITVFFLGLAFIIALLSTAASEQGRFVLAPVAAGISLLLALIGALYIIPRLARNVRLEILRFAIRTSVTVEGLMFIVFLVIIGFAAWNAGNNLLYLVLSAMLAFLIAANFFARISLVDIAVQLRFPDHIFAGEPATISVTLSNHKRFMPSYSLMVEALSETTEADGVTGRHGEGARGRGGDGATSLAASPPRPVSPSSWRSGLGKLAYFVLAPAHSSVRQRTEHTFKRRGRYPITGFRIATKFPAGFFKKWRRIDATGEILVYPRPQPLDDFYHALPMLAGRVQSHARGSGDDLYGIRRYHPSDHMRNIDWKATAKSMQMMVREQMREDEWRLTIVFDTLMPAVSGQSDDKRLHVSTASSVDAEDGGDEAEPEPNPMQEKFERAIVMAASLANHFILERADVELITTHEERNVPAGSGNEHLYKILKSLATLQPTQLPEDEAVRNKGGRRRAWKLFGRGESIEDQVLKPARSTASDTNSAVAWRLLDEMPVLRDDRRFKVLITSSAKGTIPAHVWRSAHVVFMDDL
ncbi:MAG TPA: DUF58 domain-containing protein [Blastocatellia bacterium]|nr:DUF58 domain-containing protein [Blastocatellia bacterium]